MSLFVILTLLVKELSLFVSYVKNQTFPQPLSSVDEEDALRRWKNGDMDARNQLIEHNLRLVAHIVKKYEGMKVESDDLISIGTIGLIKGIQTFKSEKGVRLATYAARCIENEVLMFMRAQRKLSRDVSIHEPIGQDKEGNEVSLLDILGTDGEEIVEAVQFRIHREEVYQGLDMLEDREKEIIWARFGLPHGLEKTQREVAKDLGISRSYVSRIEKRALEKLQGQMGQGSHH